MRALVLLHVVLPRERLMTGRADDGFLTRVFFAMAGCVTGGGEGVGAGEAGGVRAREFFLGSFWVGGGGTAGGI